MKSADTSIRFLPVAKEKRFIKSRPYFSANRAKYLGSGEQEPPSIDFVEPILYAPPPNLRANEF
jgi:hypothetical protein